MKPLRLNALPGDVRQQLIDTRKRKNLTQKELGARIGLSQKHVSEIENGKIAPRYDTVLELLRVLDLDLVVAPKRLVPVIRSIIADHYGDDRHQQHEDDRPLYGRGADVDADDDQEGELS